MTHVTFDFQSGAVLVVIAAPPVLPHRPTRSHAHRADAETGRRKGSADGDSGGFHWRRSAIVGFPGQMPRRRPRRTVRPRRSPAQSRHHLQALPRPARMRRRRPRQSRRIRCLGWHDRTPAARPPAPAPRSHLLGRILRSTEAPPGCIDCARSRIAGLAGRKSCSSLVVRAGSQAPPALSSVQNTTALQTVVVAVGTRPLASSPAHSSVLNRCFRWLRCEEPLGDEPRNPVRRRCHRAGFRGSSLTLLTPQPAERGVTRG